MQKVLSANEMREVDRLTTEREGLPSIALMEKAAEAVARAITERLGGSVDGRAILILCGRGNNGGDGTALARILHTAGANVDAFLFGRVERLKGDAKVNAERLRHLAEGEKSALRFSEIVSEADRARVIALASTDLDAVVDALFGTGLTRELSAEYAEVIDAFSRVAKAGLRVAVDLPSGLFSDSEVLPDVHFKSDVTITFSAPKLANVLPPAARANGELVIAEIGSPRELVDEQPSRLFVLEPVDATKWLAATEFSEGSYKYERGHCLLVAGSRNYAGAAVLAANSAMRSGAGLVTLACPVEAKAEIAQRLLPEVILTAIESDDFAEVAAKADTIGIGCGLSADDPAIERLVRDVVTERRGPVVADAGALGCLAAPFGIPKAGQGSPSLILTPHEGEFLRLLGTNDRGAVSDRVRAVRTFATENNVILVLKGERVLIGEPDGRVLINPTGNSGLGKAGNGDTLTGILAGFAAQATRLEIDIFETVAAAVYIAGLAGDIAEEKYGKRVMTASDVRECFAEAFERLGRGS